MGHEDWYRKTTWSPEDQKAFFARLNRSRTSYNKAQYVRIQVLHLQRVGTSSMLLSAIELIEIMLEKWPESSQLASAYLQKAQCFDALGRIEEAVQSYRAALNAEHQYPGVRTDARLYFARFVASHELNDLYEYALSELDESFDLTIFPVGEYSYFAARAIIAAHQGKTIEARNYAQRAILASQKTYSGLSHHPRLGLVESPDSKLHEKLLRLLMQNGLATEQDQG